MDYPVIVLAIFKQKAEEYSNDIDKASQMAEREIRKLPEFQDLVPIFVTKAIRQGIDDIRHSFTRRQKWFSGGAKVRVGDSLTVVEIAGDMYNMKIAGMTLGCVLGKDLKSLAEKEFAQARGSEKNGRFLMALRPLVPDNKTVQESVSLKTLCNIWKKITKKVDDAA